MPPSLEEKVWGHGPEGRAPFARIGEGAHRAQEAAGGSAAQDQSPGDRSGKKHISPERQRERAALVRTRLSCSGRSVCRWLGFNRSTMRYRPKPLPRKKRLLEAQIVKVSKNHPTLGYKKVTGLMGSIGYCVNKKLVQRVRREEGGLSQGGLGGVSHRRGRVSAVRGSPRALCKRRHIAITSGAGTS